MSLERRAIDNHENRSIGPKPLLKVTDLTTRFYLPSAVVHAVERVSLEVRRGETLGLVGESGSGKSVTVMSILRLLPATARTIEGSVELEGQSLLSLADEEMRRIRGERISLVPQNPLSALNPVLTIGWQLSEAIAAHHRVSTDEVRGRIIEALHMTGLSDPEHQLGRYPHEFSGGMRQRVLIAMAILNRPALMLADEPTTALDTTTQTQILDLLRDLIRRRDMGMVVITHNMGVIASIADRVAVMYAGEIVESGGIDKIFMAPMHPYTRMLLAASPGTEEQRLDVDTSGAPLSMTSVSGECAFRARCPLAVDACVKHPSLDPLTDDGEHSVRCWVAHAGSAANPSV